MKIMIYALLMSLLTCSLSHAAGPSGKSAKVAQPAQTGPAPFKGDPVAGKEKADAERCMECHGIDGNGQGQPNGPEGKFAKLAGQFPAYMLKQMQDLRAGKRKHDQMAIMARSVEDEDLQDILAYFGALPRMKGEGADTHEAGRKLYQQGDAARGIVACGTCHGEAGKGLSAAQGPVIGGQEWKYLEKQLQDWRSGFRRNHSEGVMSLVTKSLTDAEIQSLADYLAVQ